MNRRWHTSRLIRIFALSLGCALLFACGGGGGGGGTTPGGQGPDLTVTKSDGGISAGAGDTVLYTLVYANVGTLSATGAVLTETVPANSSFAAGGSSAGWTCAPNGNAGSTCTLAIGTVAIGGGGSVNFAILVDNPVPGGVTGITNTVTISDDGSNGADLAPANNTATDTTPLGAGAPDLTLTKDDGGIRSAAGQVISYTLDYGNSGTQTSTGVTITDTLPANTSFNAGMSSPGWSCAGAACTLNVGTLATGASASTTFAVTVDDPLAAGVVTVNNTATIADDGANGADLNPADNTATDSTPVSVTASFTPSDPALGAGTISMAAGNSSGDLFDVEVYVTDIDNFYGAAFHFNFTASSAEFVGISPDFSDSDSFIFNFSGVTFDAVSGGPGQVLVDATKQGLLAGEPASATPQLLITLRFRATDMTGGNAFSFGPAATREIQVCPDATNACSMVDDATLTWTGGTLTAN